MRFINIPLEDLTDKNSIVENEQRMKEMKEEKEE